ncbi:MAG TPA: hypothetical protein VGF69_24495 [Thermoanaerobaculia bacterium]|jgi:hypothetical protein
MNATAPRHCPDPEVLGAFFEGRLQGSELAEVGRHVEGCARCVAILGELGLEERELGIEIVEPLATDVAPEPAAQPAVPIVAPRKQSWMPTFAAAAMIALVVGGAGWWQSRKGPLTPVNLALGTAPVRPTIARISSFPYAPRPDTPRGPSDEEKRQYAVDAAASGVIGDLLESQRPEDLHAVGVSYLVLDRKYLNEAIAKLELAAKAEPDNATYWNDLASAYCTRGSEADLAHAEAAVKRALTLDPERLDAKFNHAVIVEAIGRDKEALALWQAYLAADRDPESPWRTEAEGRISHLREYAE